MCTPCWKLSSIGKAATCVSAEVCTEAEEKGYFADEGLQVNILFPSNTSDPLTMTAAGRADIGFYYQEDTIIAKANEDVPVKVLGAGCPRCRELDAAVRSVLEELGSEAAVEHVTDFPSIAAYGVMSTPALVIN